jgi:CRISPR-associated protein Cas1
LSVKNRQLQITQEEEWSIPLEDISSIVLETPQINLSAKTISLMAENQIIMYSCDEKHLPNGIFVPFACHSRELRAVKQQLNSTESFNKRCWQQIIIRKILNQMKVLKFCGKDVMGEYLENVSQKVNSGDTQNKEAIAAKAYFASLFGKKFSRENENIYNTALNYGYAIIRGAIARTIVSYGYIPSIGIHHKSELNNYNLVDDFIEPFRPIVDLWVKQNVKDETEFNKYVRAQLVNLLNMDVKIQGKLQSVNNAINIMIASYTTALNQNDYKKLELPEILELKVHEYE